MYGLMIVLAAGASVLSTGATELCRQALAAVPQMTCVATEIGVAVASDQDRAEQLALYGEAGERRFRRHFGQDPARYALIDFSGGDKLGEQMRALNQAGFKRTLPWLSRATYGAALREATRQASQAAVSAQNLEGEAAANRIADDLKAAERGLSTFEMNLFEETVVPHEIGHGWFAEAFWPGFVLDRGNHYGSPAPDWLDETAAILMESGDSAEQRREGFRQAYRSAESSNELLELRHYLNRDHPQKAENDASVRATANAEPQVKVVPEDAARQDGRFYYEQGRMFADFLMDATNNPAIFRPIATAFARDEGFGAWLNREGRAAGLADSLPALEQQWRTWLRARFGPPGSPIQN